MDLPLALSVHRFVTSVGTYVGFAALIGLAILVLLFFAQARETSALRDHVDELLDRIAGLESRLARQAQEAAQAAAAQPEPELVPRAPVALAAVGQSRAGEGLPPGPPAGVAAPALSAATRVVPLAVAPATLAANVGGGSGGSNGPRGSDESGGVATDPTPPPITPAATNGSGRIAPVGVGAISGAPVPASARASSLSRPAGPVPGRGQASPAPANRRPAPKPEAQSRELGTSPGGRHRWRIALILAAVIAMAGVAVAVAVIVHNSSSQTASSASTSPSRLAAARRAASAAAAQVNPHAITVAVLNGTATAGLAHRTAQRLTTDGFQEGKITTASDQTRTSTTVAYIPGAKAQAVAVARALKLAAASVTLVDAGTRAVACEGLPTCTASVFVTVGSNLANQ